MDIKWIEDFLSLVETQNFSAAAEKRFVTQSAYSRRIRALEDWVGASLFDRSTFPIKITEHGRKFQPYAEKVMADVNQMRLKFHRRKATKKSEMRIITLHTLMLHFMPNSFRDFDSRGVKIKVASNLTGFDPYFDEITSGAADLFVSYEIEDLHQRLSELSHIKSYIVSRENVVPVVSPGLQGKVDWNSSKKIPHLTLNKGAFLTELIRDKMSHFSDKLETVYEANLADSLMQMAKQGKGVAWLPYSVCRDEISQGTLSILGGADLIIPTNIVAYINSKVGGLITRRFCTHLESLSSQELQRVS